MFGTLVIPEPDEDFEFGLTHNEHEEYQSLWRLYVVPLRKIGTMVFRRRRPATRAEDVPDSAKGAV